MSLIDEITQGRDAGLPEWFSGMEMHVLKEMCEGYQPFGPTETYYGLAVFAHDGVTKDLARGILRAMTDRGLCQYKSGLFSEDGEPRGSGYAATDAGVARYKQLLDRSDTKGALLAAEALADAVEAQGWYEINVALDAFREACK